MPIILLIFAIIGFSIHLYFTKQKRIRKFIIEILLSYLILFGWGLGGIINFIAYIFFPYKTAELIGLQENTIFQFEIGIANLAFGVLAILCILIRMKHFRMTTIISYTIFLWGIAVGYVRQIRNFTSINTGIYFYHDIFYPIIIIGFFIWLMLIKKEKLI